MWILLMLLSLFAPGADDDDSPDPVADPDPDLDAGTDPDPDLDADLDTHDDPEPDADPDPEVRESRAQRTIRETRDRAQRAEEDLARARAELDAARRQPQGQQQPTEEQRLWDEEEAALRNPNADPWQRYAIEAKREARAANRNNQQVMRIAEDLSDKADFRALEVSKPKLYAAYKDPVEKRLQEFRAKGGNAPRRGILAVLIGEDMLAGKVKAAEPRAAPKGGANRAGSTTPRSDVSTRGGRMTDIERIEKRLDGVKI